jgi:hypothetical protein
MVVCIIKISVMYNEFAYTKLPLQGPPRRQQKKEKERGKREQKQLSKEQHYNCKKK